MADEEQHSEGPGAEPPSAEPQGQPQEEKVWVHLFEEMPDGSTRTGNTSDMISRAEAAQLIRDGKAYAEGHPRGKVPDGWS